MKRLAIQDPKTMGTLVRSMLPMEVKVEEQQLRVSQTLERKRRPTWHGWDCRQVRYTSSNTTSPR